MPLASPPCVTSSTAHSSSFEVETQKARILA